MGSAVLGVGVVAAGPVAQAIHLPTLARMSDRFDVVHVADVNDAVGREVAARTNARFSDDAAGLIADPAVDVVVVGSPDRFHADQVIAACEAGKTAVLVEKPLALTVADARSVAEASRRTGVPVIVGTMHAFDTAWVTAVREWDLHPVAAHTVRISSVLPPNPWSEDFAAEIAGRPTAPPIPLAGIEGELAAVRGYVLGLAIHDLPLARHLLPDGPIEVLSVDRLQPWGMEIVVTVGGSVLELHGVVGVGWDPDWTLEAVAPEKALLMTFPLSYVHAGSASAALNDGERVVTFGPYADDGYLNEWEHVYDVITGQVAAPDLDVLVADLAFAIEIADQAVAVAREALR